MPEDSKYSFHKEDHKHTMLVIGVLVVLILVVGAALFYVMTSKPGVPVQPPVNQTNQTPTNMTNQTNITPTCDDGCYYDRAVSQEDLSLCQQISDSGLKQQCYYELSDTSLDACKLVTDDAKRKVCITSFAVSGNDISLCDLLIAGKNDCRNAVDPCLGSSDADLCHALARNDPAECKSDSDCLLNYSLTKDDASTCELIQNAVVSKACVSAIKYTDKCDDLSTPAQKDYCYQLFAIYSDDFLACTQITPDSTYSLDCFSTFAASLHNLSICDQDGFSLNSLWACYRNYSLLSGDLSGCYAIDELATTNRFQCAYEYAKKYGNPSACQAITDTLAQRSTCYEGVIIYYPQNLDWRYCANVTNFEWKNQCYVQSAKLYDDISLCDYVEVDYAKRSCQSSYEANKTG